MYCSTSTAVKYIALFQGTDGDVCTSTTKYTSPPPPPTAAAAATGSGTATTTTTPTTTTIEVLVLPLLELVLL